MKKNTVLVGILIACVGIAAGYALRSATDTASQSEGSGTKIPSWLLTQAVAYPILDNGFIGYPIGTPGATVRPFPTQTAQPAMIKQTDPPTATPTASPEDLRTSTPQRATPLPRTVPAVLTVDPQALPKTAHDLIFIDGKQGEKRQLKRWNARSGKVEVLVSYPDTDINRFSIQPGGKTVAFERGWSDDDGALDLLDLRTLKVAELISHLQTPRQLAFSPDGQWILFSARRIGPPSDLLIQKSLFLLPVDQPARVVQVGKCNCTSEADFAWSPDSQKIAWIDQFIFQETLRTARVDRQGITELASKLLDNPEKDEYRRMQLKSWDPTGRYVLGWVVNRLDAGNHAFIFDPKTWTDVQVPGTLPTLDDERIDADWLADGRLFVISSFKGKVDLDNPSAIDGEIWRVVDSGRIEFAPEKRIVISDTFGNVPVKLAALANGNLAFLVSNADNANYGDRGIYLFDPKTSQVRKINGLPPFPDNFYWEAAWAEDGSGVIAWIGNDIGQPAFYIPGDGRAIYLLNGVIAAYPRQIAWVPD
jgi:hypothetical protein